MTLNIDGTELFYEAMGGGDLLIALHGGLGLDHTCFRPWLDPLADSCRLVYLDFRANGRSGGDGRDLTMERLAADVEALRAHLGAPQVWLLGHSYGGFVALEYALRYPEKLRGLVLLDTDSTAPSAQTMADGLQRLGVASEEMAVFGREVETTEQMLELFDVVGPWYLPHSEPGTGRALMSRTIFRSGGSEGGDRALAGWDVTDRLGEITAPALVMTGADDFMFPPASARQLAEKLPHATVEVVDGAGHLPFVEQTGKVLDRITRFLADG